MKKLKNLEGKLAIRTKPVNLGKNFIGEYCYDYSYTSSPVRILKVTESHIVYDRVGTGEEKIFGNKKSILDKRWIDDNWTSYDELLEEVSETSR